MIALMTAWQLRQAELRAAHVLARRVRARAFRAWQQRSLAGRVCAAITGKATTRSRRSMQWCGFLRFRAHARGAKVAFAIAGLTISSAAQVKNMRLDRAFARLRQYSHERLAAKSKALVAGQRGIERLASALLQPMRVLAALSIARALHRWHASIELIALDLMLRRTQATLLAEQVWPLVPLARCFIFLSWLGSFGSGMRF